MICKEINSRFVQVFEKLENDNIILSRRVAANELNYKPQALNEILKGRTNVSAELIHKFCIKYNANPIFIIIGAGNWFLGEQVAIERPINASQNPELMQIIKDKDEQILNQAREIWELEKQLALLKGDSFTSYSNVAEP